MKQQEVFRKTGEILKELSDQYEDLKSTSDNLNDLELELFIANAHFLIDHAEILRKLNLQKLQVQHTLPPHVEEPKVEVIPVLIEAPKATFIPEPKPLVIEEPKATIITPEAKKTTGEPKYFEPLVQQVKPIAKPAEPIQLEITPKEEEQPTPQIDLHTGNDKDSYSFEIEEPEVIKHDLVIDEADDWDEEEEVIPLVTEDKTRKFPTVTMEGILDDEPKVANEPKADETEEPNIVPTNPEPVIDNTPKVKEEEPVKETKPMSFNERMSAQLKGQQQTKQAEPAEAPIQDIKAAISLNDKLLFVKDLFNGYSLAYSEAIEIVNRFTNFEEADRFLKTNYVTKNNWEGKKATADKFYALLKRRYA